jgi:hypothetical protein
MSENDELDNLGGKDWLFKCSISEIKVDNGVIDLDDVFNYILRKNKQIEDVIDIKDCIFYIFIKNGVYILPEEYIDFDRCAKYWNSAYQVFSVEEYIIKSIIE